MSSSAVGRFGASSGPAGGTDVIRVFNRAMELLSNNSGDSETELLDLVKRAKREMEKEPFHLPKKARSGRAPTESSDLQSLGHRSSLSVVPLPLDHNSSPPAAAGSWGEGGSATATAAGAAVAAAAAAGIGSMTQAQARLMNVIRGGPGRGRIEKPKRKGAR